MFCLDCKEDYAKGNEVVTRWIDLALDEAKLQDDNKTN